MAGLILEFTAPGSSATLSKAIEEMAGQGQSLSALVVPWESAPPRLSMSVSVVRAEGWAIEHTNLGTIVLEDLGDGQSRVRVLEAQAPGSDEDRLEGVLAKFAGQIRRRLGAEAGG